jgi:nucleotide-binding universal stress UspA family protein
MNVNRILIAIDDSPLSEHAAELGFSIAKQFSAEVGLVNIVEPMVYPVTTNDSITGIPTMVPDINEVELMHEQTNISESIIDRYLKKYQGELTVSHFSDYGDTASGIISCSKAFNADLIVLGTHNRTGLDRLLMGSVSEHVVRHSEVPVLVVPFKEPAKL